MTELASESSVPRAAEPRPAENVPRGFLVVRASGASAVRMAIASAAGGGDPAAAARHQPETLQLLMRATLPRQLPLGGTSAAFPGCTLLARPSDNDRNGVVVLTVDTHRLSISFAELRPLLFQPVPVDRALQAVFSSAVGQLIGAAPLLDPHGVGHHLIGLAELVLRSALRMELDRVDTMAARRREAVEYIKRHLTDPDLTAERIAEALYISRRRLYQLFDDGDGVSGRIRQQRVERAKELLADPAHAVRSVGEISRMCGFANAAHFSRTFRKLVDETPRDYRDRSLRS